MRALRYHREIKRGVCAFARENEHVTKAVGRGSKDQDSGVEDICECGVSEGSEEKDKRLMANKNKRDERWSVNWCLVGCCREREAKRKFTERS